MAVYEVKVPIFAKNVVQIVEGLILMPLTFEQYIKKKSDAESLCGMAKRKRDDRAAAIGTCAKKKKKDEIVKVPPETTWNVIFTHQSQQCSYNAGSGAYYISTLMAFSIDLSHNDAEKRNLHRIQTSCNIVNPRLTSL